MKNLIKKTFGFIISPQFISIAIVLFSVTELLVWITDSQWAKILQYSTAYLVFGVLSIVAITLIIFAFIINPIKNAYNKEYFKIKKGKHRSSFILKPHFGNKISKLVTFNETCYYKYKDLNSHDINKLFGFSFGNHHSNSVRIGWRPYFFNPNQIQIFYYNYINGKRSFGLIDIVNTSEEIKMSIEVKDNKATFSIGKNKKTVFFIEPKCKLGYELYPYFGGNNVAPHKMYIQLKKR